MVKLTPRAKHYLKNIGYNDEDIPEIENGTYKYFYDYGSRVSEEVAIKRLGREKWLSGIGRARFHRTAVRDCQKGNGIIYIERVI